MRLVLVDGGETAWEGPDEYVVASVLEFVCATVSELAANGGVRVEYIDASDSPLLLLAPPGVNKSGSLTLAKGYREDGTSFMAGVGAGISCEEVDRWGPNNTNAVEISQAMSAQMSREDFGKTIERQVVLFKKTIAAVEVLKERVGGSAEFISYHYKRTGGETAPTDTTIH